MKLLHSLLLFSAFALLVACGNAPDTVRIKGEIKGISQADIIVYAAEMGTPDQVGIDTIRMSEGRFDYTRHLDSPTLLTLVYPNQSTTLVVTEPEQTIYLKGESHALKEIEVTGSDANQLLTDFRHRIAKSGGSNAQMEAASFVRTNAKSLAALAVFREYFDAVPQRNLQPATELLDLLARSQDHPLMRAVAKRLRPQLATAIGGQLPKTDLTTLGGRTLKTADFIGKPTLVVYSAVWDDRAYSTRAALRDIRTAMGDKVNIVRLAFDAHRADIQRYQDPDSLQHIVLAADGPNGTLAQRFGVRQVPGCLIVDRRGRIVATDLPTDKWLETLQRQ